MSTKIEWTDEVWNPVTGCTKVSPGCKNCYAERMARRLAGRFGYPEAPSHFDVTFHKDRLDRLYSWRKPRMIFVCSMGDLFHKEVSHTQLNSVFYRMMSPTNGHHTFLLLTKRPDRMRWYIDTLNEWNEWGRGPSNIWLGVSVENQATADERIPLLLQTPAAVRFVSCEPLLESVDLGACLYFCTVTDMSAQNIISEDGCMVIQGVTVKDWTERPGLSWVIVGGESGPGARPMHPQWARDVRDQCQAAGVPYFHKQNGEYIPADGYNQWGTSLDGKFVNPAKVRAVRVVPGNIHSTVHMVRIGKKAAGRLLDGRLWEGYPD